MSEPDNSPSSPDSEEIYPTIDEEFVRSRAAKITWEHLSAAGQSVATIFNKLEGVPELGPFEEDAKLFVALLDDFSTGAYRQIPFYSVSLGVAGLLYLIDPVDVIPDFIPGVGYVDDAQFLGQVFEMIHPDLDAYRTWKTR